jgi:hypothetical protein
MEARVDLGGPRANPLAIHRWCFFASGVMACRWVVPHLMFVNYMNKSTYFTHFVDKRLPVTFSQTSILRRPDRHELLAAHPTTRSD